MEEMEYVISPFWRKGGFYDLRTANDTQLKNFGKWFRGSKSHIAQAKESQPQNKHTSVTANGEKAGWRKRLHEYFRIQEHVLPRSPSLYTVVLLRTAQLPRLLPQMQAIPNTLVITTDTPAAEPQGLFEMIPSVKASAPPVIPHSE